MTTVVLDPHWRSMDELFSAAAQNALRKYDVIWGRDAPIPDDVLQAAFPTAEVLIAASPQISAATLERAPRLKTVIEVAGAFPATIDYAACAACGVEVLSCAPGFRSAVAEMGLAMTLSAARGLVREHEAFRRADERWLADCVETDFTLFGAQVGFVGFGQIAQEMTRLLAPFKPDIVAYDPWLPRSVANAYGVELVSLSALSNRVKVLYVTAVPTSDNHGLIDAKVLGALKDHSLVVVLSRAHLVDYDALLAEAISGRLTIATDVFPTEPLDPANVLRGLPNVLLSPHRAAAVSGGRHLIGDLILEDLNAITQGNNTRVLGQASPETIAALTGVGDADKVAGLARKRD